MPGVELATAWIRLVPSMSGVQGAVAHQLAPASAIADTEGKRAGKRFAGGFGKTIAAAGGLLAAVGIVKFLGDSVTALKEWEVINGQTAARVKSTAGAANISAKEVHKLATSIEGLTAMEAESIQKGANMLLTFKNIRNEAGKGNNIFDQTTLALANVSRAMGSEPQQTAIQLGKALNDPINSLSALSRMGIQFTDKQKNLIKSLVEGGSVMGAQKLILAELQSQYGGSGAAYADSFAGKQFLLNDAVGDLGEKIMTKVMPALLVLTTGATAVFEWMGANTGTVQIIAAALGVLAAAALVYTVAQWAMNSALLASPITWIIAAIVGLVAGIVWVATQTTFFQDVWSGAMKVIGAVTTWLWSNIISPVVTAIGAIWQWLWNSVIRPVADYIGLSVRTIGAVVKSVFGAIGDIIRGAFNGVVGFVKGIFNSIIDLINGVIGGINTVGKLVSAATGGGINIKLAKIPRLAQGGIVMPSLGGSLVNVAEAGKPEAVIPLDRWPDLLNIADGEKEVTNYFYITTPPNEDPRVVARGLAREFEDQIAGRRR